MLLKIPVFEVSREISDKLEIYKEILLKWQRSLNLISPSTIHHVEKRHFADSLQILPLINEVGTLYDLGSGSGFPGLILANFFNTHLIESDQKKYQFLKTVSREANIPVIIHNERIENVDISTPDIITARALASLIELLQMTEKWWSSNPDIKMIFFKGEKTEIEIKEAKSCFCFDCLIYQSIIDINGRILVLTNVKRIP